MDNIETAKKIASVAWDVQPKFRHRYKSPSDLADHLAAVYDKGNTSGWFLPLAVLEVVSTVDDLKATIMHAELDKVMGDGSITDVELRTAQQQLDAAQECIPLLKERCRMWFDDTDL